MLAESSLGEMIASLGPEVSPELRQALDEAHRTLTAGNNPKGAILHASSIALTLVRELYRFAKLSPRNNDNLFSWIQHAAEQGVIDEGVANYFHNPRFLSNKADHSTLTMQLTPSDADIVLRQLLRLCDWLYRESEFGPKVLALYGRAGDGETGQHGNPTLTRLIQELQERRNLGDPLVLLLGTGCSLDSPFYRPTLREIGIPDAMDPNFAALGAEVRLARITTALHDAGPSPAYLSLGRLVARGWFTQVLTVNADSFLDEAMARASIRESRVQKMSLPEQTPSSFVAALDRELPQIKLVKLAGDFRSTRLKTVPPDLVTLDPRAVKVIARLLRRGVLVIGLRLNDPDFAGLLLDRGEPVWMMDCCTPSDERLQKALAARKSEGNVCPSPVGAFENLLPELERALARSVLTRLPVGSEPVTYGGRERRQDRLEQLQRELEELEHAAEDSTADQKEQTERYRQKLLQLHEDIERLSHAGEGTILGHFKLGERLGRGSSGSVYRAVHVFTKVQAAVKVLDRERAEDPQCVARFFRGARVMHELNHSNIVRILDPGGRVGLWCYYAMELIDGPNLEAMLSAGVLAPDACWSVAEGILDGVAYAHRRQNGPPIVHRDLKPANVLLCPDGTPKLTDFDTAFLENATVLSFAPAVTFGTSFYLPPELEVTPTIEAQRDPRIDVYAIGRILLRLFTGIPPRESLVSRCLGEPDGLRSALSARIPGRVVNLLSTLILRATAWDPQTRFPDATALLERFRVVKTSLTRAVTPVEMPIKMCRIPASELRTGDSTDKDLANRQDQDQGVIPAKSSSLSQISTRRVRLTKPFLLSSTPITRGLWARVFGEPPPLPEEETVPVEYVSWYSAICFCSALSEAYGYTPCYRFDEEGVVWDQEADGFRLPTEAEWEYACRAGSSTRFYLGDAETDLARSGWYSGNCSSGPVPVGRKEPNRFGLMDMHGNVWEWCWDWYDLYPEDDQVDPIGPTGGLTRVLRGGSWRREAIHCTSATRYDSNPSNKGRSLGMRVARTLNVEDNRDDRKFDGR